MVFRGDDCVSLAWCFWHRSCYACLLCGSGNVVHGVKVRDLFENGEVGKAREVEEIPLCAQCFVEVEAVRLPESTTVVEKALTRMEYSDRGLGRRRRESQHKGAGVVDKVREPVRLELDKTNIEQKPPSLSPEERIHQEADDETSCDCVGSRDGVAGCRGHLSSTIYVDISDPVNKPAFKPSPTKPIPTWMLPPIHKGNTSEPREELSLKADEQSTLSTPTSVGEVVQRRPSTPVTHLPTLKLVTPRPISTPPYTGEGVPIPRYMRYSRAGFISNEPLKRPSSRLGHRQDTSYDTPRPYLTPPEYPLAQSRSDYFTNEEVRPPVEDQQSATDAQVPRAAPPASSPRARAPSRGSPFFGGGARVNAPRTKSPAFLKAKMAFETQGTPSPPQMSSEYIDRYQPVRPTPLHRNSSKSTISPPAVKRRKSQSLPDRQKAAPIIARITKATRARPSVDLTSQPALASRRGSAAPVPVDTLVEGLHVIQVAEQAAKKRQSSQADLKRWFGR